LQILFCKHGGGYVSEREEEARLEVVMSLRTPGLGSVILCRLVRLCNVTYQEEDSVLSQKGM
jgi:predicted HTH domain antitoxin